jgi:hypothetical protein
MTCKGICERHRAKKPLKGTRYGAGQKRCSICDIFIQWDGRRCPCCNYMLKTRNLKRLWSRRLVSTGKPSRILDSPIIA